MLLIYNENVEYENVSDFTRNNRIVALGRNSASHYRWEIEFLPNAAEDSVSNSSLYSVQIEREGWLKIKAQLSGFFRFLVFIFQIRL